MGDLLQFIFNPIILPLLIGVIYIIYLFVKVIFFENPGEPSDKIEDHYQ
jgi:hypothetical protein